MSTNFLKNLLLFSPETGFGGAAQKRTTKTAHKVTYGDPSSAVDFTITHGDTLVTIDSSSATFGDITITYTLRNYTATTSSVVIEYSLDEENWSTATAGSGSPGLTSKTTTQAGTEHTYIWDSATDVGLDFRGNAFLRITAYDEATNFGNIEYSNSFKISVDNAPNSPTIVSPASGFYGKDDTVEFLFTIPQPIAGDTDMHFWIQVDTDENFNSENLVNFESKNDQIGWEYDATGSGGWITIPHDGVPLIDTPALVGNQARFTVQVEDKLPVGDKYWRIYAGGVFF